MSLSPTYLHRLTFDQRVGTDVTLAREPEERQLMFLQKNERTRDPWLEVALESSLHIAKGKITKLFACITIHDLFQTLFSSKYKFFLTLLKKQLSVKLLSQSHFRRHVNLFVIKSTDFKKSKSHLDLGLVVNHRYMFSLSFSKFAFLILSKILRHL